MLGRVADNIFWLSRYIERVSNTARLIEASSYLNLDFKINHEEQWVPLIEISGNLNEFKNNYDCCSRDEVLHWLIYNENYQDSLRSCLIKARDLKCRFIKRVFVSRNFFRKLIICYLLFPKNILIKFHRIIIFLKFAKVLKK